MTSPEQPRPQPGDTFGQGIVAAAVILSAAFVFMLAWTWNGWCDPLVDFGRELYVPWRIIEGDLLYRDIAYFNGPLSPHFNALVMRIFGVSLRSIQVVNITLFAALVCMTWRLLRLGGTEWLGATLACLVQICVFGFLQLGTIGNYNFITPYSHELTHGVVLSFAAMLCAARFARTHRRRWESAAGALVGACFLTKPEVFVAAAAAVGLCIISRGGSWRFALSLLIAPVLAVLLLASQLSLANALHGVLGAWVYMFDPRINQMKFYQRIFGLLDPASNIHSVLVQCVWYAAMSAVVVGSAMVVRGGMRRQIWPGVMAMLLMAGAMALIYRIPDLAWQVAFRGIVVVVLAMVIALALWRWRRRDAATAPRDIVRLMLALFALLLLGKMLLNVLLYHYGFALAMPAVVVIIAGMASWGPQIIDARGGSGNVARGAAVAVAGFVIFLHLRVYGLYFAEKPLAVGASADGFRSGDQFGRDQSARLMLEALAKLPAGATVATVPEGVMLNYLSRRENPTGFINLMPPEVMMFGQKRILRSFEINPPDYIVLVLRSDPADFGYKSFAADYGREIYRWIEQNYRQIPAPTDPRYPMLLLERTNAQ